MTSRKHDWRLSRALGGCFGLLVFLLAPLLFSPGASANVKSECCFLLTAKSSGNLNWKYRGDSPPDESWVGSGSYKWSWGTQEIVAYTEEANYPQLVRVGDVGLANKSSWSFNELGRFYANDPTTPPARPCNRGHHFAPILTENDFSDIKRKGDVPENAQRLHQRFVLSLDGEAGLPQLLDCDSPVSLFSPDAPPDGNGLPDPSRAALGPSIYYLSVPPRADLRHSAGGRDHFETTYSKNPSFQICSSDPRQYSMSQCGLHNISEQTQITAQFDWFPRSRLKRELKELRKRAG